MSALLFGPYIGVIGGGLGSGIGAVLGGYPYWFVPTTVIESVNALTTGFIGHGRGRPMMILACLVGGFCFWMGYFLVEIAWFGLGPALIELPLNVVQWMVCLVVAIAVVTVVQRAYPPVKYWAVKRKES